MSAPDEPRPEPSGDSTQALPGKGLKAASPPRRPWPWLVLGLVVLAGAGALWFYRSRPAALPPVAEASTEYLPPELRSYVEKARAGDAQAMHMLAVMYWNGLNVRQDRAKGLEWYRKAAAAGSTAAQKTLQTIQQP